ncbi:MAG: hypothetical protein WAJ93_22035 [Candidatus Nitrosopolaris sp.]
MICSRHSRVMDPSYHTVVIKDEQRFWKRILIVDDDADVTLTGFELYEKILAIDINVKVCFMSSVQINREALREIYPISLGCVHQKTICLNELGQNWIKRVTMPI